MKMLKHIVPLATLALVAACSNGGDVDEQAEMTPDQPASSAPADTATEPTETTAPTTTPGSDAAAPLASGTWQVVDTRLTRPGGVQAIGDAELEAARSLQLVVSDDDVRWQGNAIGTTLKAYSFGDNCSSPERVTASEGRFALRCSDGQFFGPSSADEPSFATQPDGTVTVNWYDGITLILSQR